MNHTINKMKYADVWCTDDICKVLSENNQEIGREVFFREVMYSAQNAKKIKPIYVPGPSLRINGPATDYAGYNYEYKREDIIDWILSKAFVFPPELNHTNKKQTQTNSDKIESVNMNIIAGMLNALLGKGANGVKYSRFEDQASIINHLMANIKLEGISKRTLEDRFAKANQILKQLENS